MPQNVVSLNLVSEFQHELTQFGRNIKPCVQSHTRVALALAIAGLLRSAAVTMSQAAQPAASSLDYRTASSAHKNILMVLTTTSIMLLVCGACAQHSACREDFDQIRRTTGLRAGEVRIHFHMATCDSHDETQMPTEMHQNSAQGPHQSSDRQQQSSMDLR